MKYIKIYASKYIEYQCDRDPEYANDKSNGFAIPYYIVVIHWFLNFFQTVIGIVLITYFFAMIWLIVCEAVEDLYYDRNYHTMKLRHIPEYDKIKGKYFITVFETFEDHPYTVAIMLLYYSFTTITTVGFGDYKPISNSERVLATLMMFLGTIVFSIIMGKFSNTLEVLFTSND